MTAQSGRGGQPLFYHTPEPLSAEHHGALRLLEGDYRFAAHLASLDQFAALLERRGAPATQAVPVV